MNSKKVLLFILLCMVSASLLAYKPKGHREITANAKRVKEYIHGSEDCWKRLLFKTSLQEEFLTQAFAEDWSSPGSGWWQFWRPMYHFYNPATHHGMVPWKDAVEKMAELQKGADKSLKRVSCSLKRGDSGAAAKAMRKYMRYMGSIAHISEDLTLPEHSLNVSHIFPVSNEDIWAMPLNSIYDKLMELGPDKYQESGRAAFIAQFGASSGQTSIIEAIAQPQTPAASWGVGGKTL